MPLNGFNVGSDYTASYFDGSSGQLIDFGDVQSFSISEMKHDVNSKPYNNDPRYGYISDGFKIEFTITRTSSAIEDFMVQQDQNFRQGTVQKPGFLNISIINPDQSTRRYQYQNCVIFLTDHGDVSREKTVTLKIEGMASKKVQIA